MDFIRFELREDISVRRLITFSYKELGSDHVHTGEQHDFWEFVYVDKGEVEIRADRHVYPMRQGDIVFYKPNSFHSLRCNHTAAPNLFVVSFDCDSPAMAVLENESFRLGDEERNLLARIVQEGYRVFDPPIDHPRVPVLNRRADAPFGSEQLIKLYLELLLVQIVRRQRERSASPERPSRLSTTGKDNKDQALAAQLAEYVGGHLHEDLTPERLCSVFAISRTQLKSLFRTYLGLPLTEYAGKQRIERAKSLIREQGGSCTEIAEQLGYSSIHYFSRHFKKATGMAPTEYARTVKARMAPAPPAED